MNNTEQYITDNLTFYRNFFDGKKINPVLPYNSPSKSEQTIEMFIENRKRISISGVQEKLSMVSDKGVLRLTNADEQGTYILKPIPRDLKNTGDVPANEHLTMQIARQIYRINTAENCLVFFRDGTPAYLTKRFDINKNDKTKFGKEDFASLAGKSHKNEGVNFKYNYSYEEIGLLIKQFIPAWRVEIEKYFVLVVFNYLFSNGDAHLKNFSLLQTLSGDYILSPAYDLVNTRLHVDDTDFALSKGLFVDNFKSEYFQKKNHAGRTDFIEFARRIGVYEKRIEKLLLSFLQKYTKLEDMIQSSLLSEQNKRAYLLMYQTRLNYLKEN
ncbi:MAG: HipA domain-containing protein [Bacteroidales bacterium]|jgi:serine/threonine-protein kinase HipA|nr:HipA domain-containing protein [Bacteroidales bacterium]